MHSRIHWPTIAIVVAIIACAGPVLAEVRTWTDASGQHQVEAEFLSYKDGQARLLRTDGKEITIAIDRLSSADRAYVRKQVARKPAPKESRPAPAERPEPAEDSTKKSILQIAETFFENLRTKEREEARGMLTEAARALVKEGASPLDGLPTPDEQPRSIRLGRVRIDGAQAEVPVQVRVAGVYQSTTLHLRNDVDQWRVFALSATLNDMENTINFETPVAKAEPGAEQTDPLAELVGKDLPLAGVLLDGTPLDMSRFAGKVVLIDFWATWCGPCRAEMPNILANYQQYHALGFDVIAISVDRDLRELQKFVLQESPPWTVVADHHPANRNPMGDRYGIRGIPAFILLGKDGKVAAVHCRGERLGQQLAQLLGGGNEARAQN